jgi:hypothetical protein
MKWVRWWLTRYWRRSESLIFGGVQELAKGAAKDSRKKKQDCTELKGRPLFSSSVSLLFNLKTEAVRPSETSGQLTTTRGNLQGECHVTDICTEHLNSCNILQPCCKTHLQLSFQQVTFQNNPRSRSCIKATLPPAAKLFFTSAGVSMGRLPQRSRVLVPFHQEQSSPVSHIL